MFSMNKGVVISCLQLKLLANEFKTVETPINTSIVLGQAYSTYETYLHFRFSTKLRKI